MSSPATEPAETPAPDQAPAGPLTLAWDQATVPLEALERALYALADQASGTIAPTGTDWTLTIHPRGPHPDARALEHRLRQEVTDQTLRVRIAERTDPIRNLVFALAFSRSGLVESTPASTTTSLTAASTTAASDPTISGTTARHDTNDAADPAAPHAAPTVDPAP